MPQQELIQKLQQLCDEINQQLPYKPNMRFDYGQNWETMQERSVDYQHHSFLKSLNELFHDFTKIHGPFKNLTEDQKEILSATIEKSINEEKLCIKLKLQEIQEIEKKELAARNNISLINLTYYMARLEKMKITDIMATFKQDGELSLDNNDKNASAEESEKLFELRLNLEQRLLKFKNPQFFLSLHGDESHLESIEKIVLFDQGLHLEQTKSLVGQCGEHTALGLLKIFKKKLLTDEDVLELITITYYDKQGRMIDNHLFFAINREGKGARPSTLEDMSTWDPESLVFDSWAKKVNLANEVNLKEENTTWTALKFTRRDIKYLDLLTNNHANFTMTGHTDPNKLSETLKKEYQLQDMIACPEADKLLNFLLELVRPPSFPVNITFYLTHQGTRLINILSGFDYPVIAIHHEMLTALIQDGNCDMLAFGLAQALVTIKKNGIGCEELQHKQQFTIDQEALTITQNNEAAIAYLQAEARFINTNTKEEKWTSILNQNPSRNENTHFQQRIKNLMVVIAHKNQTKATELDDVKIKDDINWDQLLIDVISMPTHNFYTDEYNNLSSKIEKINFLTDKLITLKENELIPYEISQLPSSRAREFCKLLFHIKIDWHDDEQVQAIDRLITQALILRISVFNRIYIAIFNDSYNSLSLSTYISFPALGPFKLCQTALTAFSQANNMKTAQSSANEFLKHYESLKTHFFDCAIPNVVEKYNREFRKTHEGKYPHGDERFFGSTIGRQIIWNNFKEEDAERINQYINWAKQDQTRRIANMLFCMGINIPAISALLPIAKVVEIFNYKNQHNLPLSLPKSLQYLHLDQTVDFEEQTIIHFSNCMHVDTQMFAENISFEEKFIRFYDANYLGLILPRGDLNKNNKFAMNFLLEQFNKIVISGSKAEKEVVKSFFSGRKDNRDFKSLKKIYSDKKYYSFSFSYLKFCFSQHKDASLQLFSKSEQIALLDEYTIGMPAPTALLINLFSSSANNLSLENIEFIFKNMLDKNISIMYAYDILTTYATNRKLRSLFTNESAKFLKLVDRYDNPYHKLTHLKLFTWEPPTQFENISTENLIALYQIYEKNFLALCPEDQITFGDVVLKRIRKIYVPQKKISALEQLLFLYGSIIKTPIANILLKNQAIDLWVSTIVRQYGRDDKSDSYFASIQEIIERIEKNTNRSDCEEMLSKLANGICAQQSICEKMGFILDPNTYRSKKPEDIKNSRIEVLSTMSAYLGSNIETLKNSLDFLTENITNSSIKTFSGYLINSRNSYGFLKIVTQEPYSEEHRERLLSTTLYNFYQSFWNRSLKERAILIDYLAIPASRVTTEGEAQAAYAEFLEYACKKLFPQAHIAKSEDELAFAILTSYLATADKYSRSILLAGILTASNKLQKGETISIGKKLALICEHMGPAYIKLAQAIQSHPLTPQHIKNDLAHVKSQANPPHRWDLFRLMTTVVPEKIREKIKHVGKLLGSASYNLALEVTVKTDEGSEENQVLTLLRENAEFDAKKGFQHLKRTIDDCKHPQVKDMHDQLKSILEEAERLSISEMHHAIAIKQTAIAQELYKNMTIPITVDNNQYKVEMYHTTIHQIGHGYRFLERMHGEEFNSLPEKTPEEKRIKKATAIAVFKTELSLILQGGHFDTDRHGAQLRVKYNRETKCIRAGLYDFGEMSTTPPTDKELKQFAGVIKEMTSYYFYSEPMDVLFNKILGKHIKTLTDKGESARYLIRIRKALLALSDFQKYVDASELKNIFLSVMQKRENIHPILSEALPKENAFTRLVGNVYGFFNRTSSVQVGKCEAKPGLRL